MPVQVRETHHFSLPWQKQLADAFSSIPDLCAYLELPAEHLATSPDAHSRFPIRVPLSFAASMEKGNPNDPLLRQVLPINDEVIDIKGFINDPVGDINSAVLPGLLHKYQGRVLLITTGACAIHCRYCFRRNFPYGNLQLNKQQEKPILDYILSDTSISEVILSGGDPLLLSDLRLTQLIQQLEAIDHIKRIRIHSRLPIVLPSRITEALVKTWGDCSKTIVLVVHTNHPNELSNRTASAFTLLKQAGITIFNQSVLLKGVNDDATILCNLSQSLFAQGVIPYYLHLLDKATGTGHFEVSESEATHLIKQVQNTLPGYLVPKLVKETAGYPSKQYV